MKSIKFLTAFSMVSFSIVFASIVGIKAFDSAIGNVSGRRSSRNECIITIDEQRYDILSFIDKHDGGDIFKCDEDNTHIFYSKHNEKDLRKIEKYKI